ncbi:trypsin-like peptidase domain-containing protein [Nocardia farcinica]|uniref:Periplasmic pH-dependent serine endoprotease DegQ n=2 Tax=Nocardia TaxID=1817 RepID=A0A449GJY8_NOCFR|nr:MULTISPECIES: trypsin-like peptidase domain-containing protein [Nocardia]MBA4857397.1 trypsin-like peptidase domain-containing protein [Nocardia farcinica]MBC9816901.1 trypsin-like peptidase domain-containing protein [Nocardia farcinica]MBF6071129.1 trypsin-like peptidase domain-containing protein [Nocardia farcinica]MBF6141206.1 trypsin-like peptidase domain-containing protein [Nocardia farcinica]MBF6186946.1 trypsin-like peptidase domain-containing protein [Nocardia farcinica]
MQDEPRGSGGRWSALLVAAVLALAGFLGFRGELPGWPFGDTGTTAAPTVRPPNPPLDQAAVAAEVTPALVNISTRTRPLGQGAAGTGIVLTADGQVLTSHHVVKGAEQVVVTTQATGAEYRATVLGYDSTADIALLSLPGANGLPTARLGSSSSVRVRDEVLALGNAGGTGGPPTATPGLVTALNSTIVALNAADLSRKALRGMVEVAAPVSSGQSGGALVDWQGAVVGVVTASSGEAAAELERPNGYAVPIDTAMRVVRQIRSGIPTDTVHIGPTATLGVLISDASPSGARIDVALYGLPAYAAGLADGEVIVSIDGRPIGSARVLRTAIDRRRPGETVRLGVLGADGVERTVTVELGLGTPN